MGTLIVDLSVIIHFYNGVKQMEFASNKIVCFTLNKNNREGMGIYIILRQLLSLDSLYGQGGIYFSTLNIKKKRRTLDSTNKVGVWQTLILLQFIVWLDAQQLIYFSKDIQAIEWLYCKSFKYLKRVNAYTLGVNGIYILLPLASIGYLGGVN